MVKFAYHMKKRTKAAAINTAEGELKQNVAAIKEVSKDYPISKRQGGNTTSVSGATPKAKSDQSNGKAQ